MGKRIVTFEMYKQKTSNDKNPTWAFLVKQPPSPTPRVKPVKLPETTKTSRNYKKEGEEFFTRAYTDRTRHSGFKLKENRFRLHREKKFRSVRVVRRWNRLPREAVNTPSLEVFKMVLNRAWRKVSPPVTGVGTRWSLGFLPTHSMILWWNQPGGSPVCHHWQKRQQI